MKFETSPFAFMPFSSPHKEFENFLKQKRQEGRISDSTIEKIAIEMAKASIEAGLGLPPEGMSREEHFDRLIAGEISHDPSSRGVMAQGLERGKKLLIELYPELEPEIRQLSRRTGWER